ncbi:Rhodanese-like protein [Calocera viscosa TUFC12733]|uniref:M-phase inducer phosphatase n=1 Tax=Calocera viscosa (strain TUFC12733) TaxID=1330018 RepID=A0A167LI51_CALVF|nr:Rhodanese-like protein [Calocera viscosa TUFC12733]
MAGAEVSSDDADGSLDGSPLLAAQRAYAKRTQSRLVTRADGSPAFRPLRNAVEQGSKRESCPVQMHAGQPFAGFAHNEQEGKILPCHKVKDDGLMRITPQTVEAVLNGDYDPQLAALHIVDCRFDYEFAGGHIDGAVNLRTTDAVEEYFLQAGCGISLPSPSRSGEHEQGEKKTVIIFHCEFSVKRAPTIAKHLRSKDRALNAHCYPKVHFPEIYILQGGYYDFYKRNPAHCEPQGYVAMLDPRHAGACSPSLGQFRQGSRWQRARSYTYGDHTMQRPKSVAQPPALPFAATTAAAAAAAVKKRRTTAQAQALTSVREDHSSSEDAFGSLGSSPCPRIPPQSRPPSLLDAGRPKSLVGRSVFERAVSFRQ